MHGEPSPVRGRILRSHSGPLRGSARLVILSRSERRNCGPAVVLSLLLQLAQQFLKIRAHLQRRRRAPSFSTPLILPALLKKPPACA